MRKIPARAGGDRRLKFVYTSHLPRGYLSTQLMTTAAYGNAIWLFQLDGTKIVKGALFNPEKIPNELL